MRRRTRRHTMIEEGEGDSIDSKVIVRSKVHVRQKEGLPQETKLDGAAQMRKTTVGGTGDRGREGKRQLACAK